MVQEVWDLVDEYHVDPHGEVFDHTRFALRLKLAVVVASVVTCHMCST